MKNIFKKEDEPDQDELAPDQPEDEEDAYTWPPASEDEFRDPRPT